MLSEIFLYKKWTKRRPTRAEVLFKLTGEGTTVYRENIVKNSCLIFFERNFVETKIPFAGLCLLYKKYAREFARNFAVVKLWQRMLLNYAAEQGSKYNIKAIFRHKQWLWSPVHWVKLHYVNIWFLLSLLSGQQTRGG